MSASDGGAGMVLVRLAEKEREFIPKVARLIDEGAATFGQVELAALLLTYGEIADHDQEDAHGVRDEERRAILAARRTAQPERE